MSKRLSQRDKSNSRFYKRSAFVSILILSTALSGCVSLDRPSIGSYGVDQFTTASTATTAQANLNQALPNALPNPDNKIIQLATSSNSLPKYLPPASIGNLIKTQNATFTATPINQPSNIVSSNLPNLTSTPALGSKSIMPAQTAIVQTNTASLNTAPLNSAPVKANLDNAYIHVVQSGESLYSIARKYNVSVSSIVSANAFSSADKIGVGQKIGIPGREDLIAKQEKARIASATPLAIVSAPVPAPKAASTANSSAPQAKKVVNPVVQTQEKLQIAAIAPVKSTQSETFRWPVSGKLITDFAASKGTGINISAAQGAPVRSSASGTVIYVGNAVEGYGNLILVKHDNGFVSAYAHLEKASVSKGDVIKSGSLIGTVGQTGSVNSPQLHFELRKGATPVDPIPMLAS